MAISTTSIILRAGYHLLDESHIRWTVAELIEWINEGARAIVGRRYDAGAFTDNFEMLAGSRQDLGSNVYRLIDVTRNMGTGSTPGRIIKRVDRQLMDVSDPDWHTATPDAVTRQFAYDDKGSPNVFYVHPPAVAGKVIEVIISRFPPVVANGQDLDLTEDFEEALVNYVLYRCYAKDSEYGDPGKAAAMYSAFTSALGLGGAEQA